MLSKIVFIFLLLLPFAVTCNGQQVGTEQPVSLNNFGGLNTVDGLFSTQPNQARVAHNVDFSRAAKGTICPRWGYDSISYDTSTYSDSIIDIFVLPYSDGSERLLVIIDTPIILTGAIDGRYGNVKVTQPGSTNLDSLTLIESFFPISGDISALLYRDILYLSSSTGRGLAWDGTNHRKWPLCAPGEPSIIPINSSVSKLLDGEYRYMFLHKVSDSAGTDTSYSKLGGVITTPVRVSTGGLRLQDFPEMSGDSGQISKTTEIMIYRTRGDVGRIDGGDYAYYIGRNLVVSPTAYSYVLDTLHDDSLPVTFAHGSFDSIAGLPESVLVVDGRYVGEDTIRYGTGGLFAVHDTANDQNNGIFSKSGTNDTLRDENILGFAYTFSYSDTILGLVSDTSRSLIIYEPDSSARGYSINTPRVPYGYDGLLMNIYRAPLFAFSFDTTRGFNYGGDPCEWTGGYVWDDFNNKFIKEFDCVTRLRLKNLVNSGAFYDFHRLTEDLLDENADYLSYQFRGKALANFWVTPDSLIVGAYHKIGMVGCAVDTEIVFLDTSLTMDSLKERPLLSLRYVPPFLNQTFVSNNRLYGISGDGVYYSHLDSVATFGVFNQVALSVADGEDITLAFEMRNTLRAFKETSNYNLWHDPQVGLNQQEVSGGIGCLAPNSYAYHATGHYYLSNFGVIRENEGDFLERRQKYERLSFGRIDAFDDMTTTKLKRANAVIFNDKYMLSIDDTTYVYDILADAWSTWDMPFKKAVVYRNSADYTGLLGDSLFFIKQGEKNLYQYARHNRDNDTTEVTVVWKSVELSHDRYLDQLSAVGLWVTDSVPAGTSFEVKVFEADADTTTTVVFDSVSFAHRYLEKQMPKNLSRYFQIQITSSADTSGVGISGIEPIIVKQGLVIRK